MQGSVTDLRERGLLESIVRDSANESTEEQIPTPIGIAVAQEAAQGGLQSNTVSRLDNKKARKLIKDESRATGSVAWSGTSALLNSSDYTALKLCHR